MCNLARTWLGREQGSQARVVGALPRRVMLRLKSREVPGVGGGGGKKGGGEPRPAQTAH